MPTFDEFSGGKPVKRTSFQEFSGGGEIKREGAQSPQKGFWESASNVAEKGLQTASDLTINPIGKAMAQPFVSAYQGVKAAVTGKAEPESVNTPWGKVKSSPTAGDLGWEALDIASLVPAEKLFVGAAKAAKKTGEVVGKVLGKAGTKTGEIMTGVPRANISSWYKLAKEAPEKVASTIEHVKANPTEPMKSLVTNVADKIKGMREEGKALWKTGKEVFKKENPEAVFDVSSNLMDARKAIQESDLGLDIVNLKNKSGKFSGDFSIRTRGKSVPGKPGEAEFETLSSNAKKVLKETLVKLGRAKDISIDEVDNLSNFFNKQYGKLDYKKDAFGIKALNVIKKQTEDKIQTVLPDALKQARQKYRDYYEVKDLLGKNIIDRNGNVKDGAERFMNTIMNANKGVIRDNATKAAEKLGIDVVEEANNIKLAKSLLEQVPNTTRSRTTAIVRGIMTMSGLSGNVPVFAGATLLNTVSNPNTFRNLIEITAGASKKLPVSEALKKLSKEEMVAIQQIIKGIIEPPLREDLPAEDQMQTTEPNPINP